MIKVLNTYSGLGGNRLKWAGVSVTSVENQENIAAVYRNQFPEDTLVICDAHQYILDYHEAFDFVWSSPPCQKHSRMVKATRHKKNCYIDLQLYQQIIFFQHFRKEPWVVENVKPYYEPLIPPTAIIGRHYFWSNFPIAPFELASPPNFITADSPKAIQAMKDWLGIQYEGNIYYGTNHSPGQVLRNCVHPDLGKHIFDCAFRPNSPPIINQENKQQQLTLAL